VTIPGWAKAMVRAVSALHTRLYRLFGGKGLIARNTVILTTRGRKTGRPTSIPLFHVVQGNRVYVVASFGGNDVAPGWYKNLVANPDVEVELNGVSGRYRARSLSPDEAKPVWPALLAMYPPYEAYQKRTTRVIPVVELKPIGA
jgi:deazaflavin-dependent oxidoreductase (nitroreductase family)